MWEMFTFMRTCPEHRTKSPAISIIAVPNNSEIQIEDSAESWKLACKRKLTDQSYALEILENRFRLVRALDSSYLLWAILGAVQRRSDFLPRPGCNNLHARRWVFLCISRFRQEKVARNGQ
jgi:hypothetical protein